MTRSRPGPKSRVLITGGAGFVATNLADRLLHDGYTVALFDNLSRPGVQQNVEWLRQTYGPRVQVILGDVRDRDAVSRAMRGIAQVYHFAAQVAVTTSLTDPFLDFDVNARGTLNVLEAARASQAPPSILFTSTNKVYGRLDDVELLASGTRYEPIDPDVRRNGFDEHRPLDFHSPYGCSKGAAEQYVLDYAHTFGLKAIVFRMSCIFGPHQFGTEDQGWIAHFLIAALRGLRLTVYGDGLQVRDALFVEDLVEAMIVAHRDVDVLSGQAFNMGGGPEQTTSLLELLQLIAELTRRTPSATLEGWRTADQRYFVSDTTKFRNATGWRPRVGLREGVTRLRDWLVGVAHDNPAGDLVTS